GGVAIARLLALSDLEDHLGLGRRLEGNSRNLGVSAAHRPDAGAFLRVGLRLQLAAQEPDFTRARVVPDKKFAIPNNAAAEAGAQRHSEQVFETLGAARFFEEAVDVGQKAGNGLAIHKEVAVIVDEDRDAEFMAQHRTQGDAAPEAVEIAQIADDSIRIIGG